MGANLLLSVFFLSLCSTSYSLLMVSTVAKMGLSCACTLTMATFVFPKKRYVLEIDEVPPPVLMVRLMILMGNVKMMFLSGKACQLYTNLAYSSDLARVEVNARAKIMRRGTMKAYWCSFGTSYNWGRCDHPHPKKPQSGSRPCVFPFKYNGVMYTECTDVQWRNKWCATATNWKDEYVGAWGDCEIRESV